MVSREQSMVSSSESETADLQFSEAKIERLSVRCSALGKGWRTVVRVIQLSACHRVRRIKGVGQDSEHGA